MEANSADLLGGLYPPPPGTTPIRPAPRSRLGWALVGNGEIDLALEYVDPGDKHPQLVADREAAAGLPADQAALGRVESIEVVGQR